MSWTACSTRSARPPPPATDRVETALAWSLGAEIEDLTLTGAASVAGTGNGLNNRLTGNGAANVLDAQGGSDTLAGGGGADTLKGGDAGDVYVVFGADRIVETSTGGADTVQSAASYSMVGLTFVEGLQLTGAGSLSGTGNGDANVIGGNRGANRLAGNGGDDTLWGNDGADSLSGGLANDSLEGGNGADTLIGGTGADLLRGGADADVFRFANAGEGNDTILDWTDGLDVIQVSAAGFLGGLGTVLGAASSVALPADRLVSNTTGLADPAKAFGHFILETDANTLWWDRDGSGALSRRRRSRW